MALIKNKTTRSGREFWAHVESVASQVRQEKDAAGAEVASAKKIPNKRPHGSPFAPREIPTALGMSGTPINKEPFHPKPSVTYGAPWVGGNRDIDPFNDDDVKAFQERDRQAMELLNDARPENPKGN
jgi:hypothetical protein